MKHPPSRLCGRSFIGMSRRFPWPWSRPIQQSIIQIDVYAEKYMDAITAGKAVEDALAAAFAAGTLQGIQRSRRSQYEPEVKLRRLIYEYSFWYH